MNYLIIKDAQTALSALKDGQIDIMGSVDARSFEEMQGDAELESKLAFHSAALYQTYYIVLNTQDPILNDKRVRRALAHLVDVDQLNANRNQRSAIRTIGPIHPSKSYYNSALEPIPYDVEKAKQLLSEAGWEDTDGNGTRDKVIGGQKMEMQLEFVMTNQELGRAISLLLIENGKKVGIEVETEAKEFSQILQDMDKGDFQMTPLRLRTGAYLDDLYSSWHRAGIRPGGRNFCRFGNDESDSIIEATRNAMDDSQRAELYRKIQEMIYEEQPAIFLFCPPDLIVSNRKFEVITSSRRPGFFENDFKMIEDQGD